MHVGKIQQYQIQEKRQILGFLDSKKFSDKDDPDKKWSLSEMTVYRG